jgi:hypothetical protein
MRRSGLWILAPVLALLLATGAEAKKQDATKMTCQEFASHSTDQQLRVAAFLDGYSKRGKPVEEVADVAVERDLDVLIVACHQDPKATVWDKLKAKLPGGKRKVKPVAMTCEEYLGLESDNQAEVAYWLEGYNRKAGATVEGEASIDVEHDTAVLVEECKPTPKGSVWERIKGKLE